MDIRKLVSHLIKYYGTRNPFDIATAQGTIVLNEELGAISGYYNKAYRIKQIHINQNLDDHFSCYTCAHELGHSIMHPNSNTPFLKANTLFSTDKLEIEANAFAMELLVPNEVILENIYFTVNQLSRLLGYSEELIKLRLKSFRDI